MAPRTPRIMLEILKSNVHDVLDDGPEPYYASLRNGLNADSRTWPVDSSTLFALVHAAGSPCARQSTERWTAGNW